jgi:hypothetical protein
MNESKIGSGAADSDASGESDLRGAALDGAERDQNVAFSREQKKRDPDAVVRLDGEEDTLYHDGLKVEDESLTLADTHGRDK